MLLGLHRFWVLEMNFLRRPAWAAAFSDKIQKHAERQFRVLPPLHDGRCFNLIFKTHEPLVACNEAHSGAFLVIGKKLHEILERTSERGRGQRGITPEA